MKYLPLIFGALLRRKTRTIFTLLSVVAAFLLFGLLDSVRGAFAGAGNKVAGVDRLVTISKISLTVQLPKSLLERISAVPGVSQVAYANWFGGIYQDPKNFFPNVAVSPNYFGLFPEWQISAAERQAFHDTRTGAVVGERLANRFGWKLGDKIPLQATIFPLKSGGNTWTFDLVGIFDDTSKDSCVRQNNMYIRYDYFDEARQFGQGGAGLYAVRLSDPNQAEAVSRPIDRIAENSDHETKTQTEKAFQTSFVSQFGDIGLIVGAIIAAVFFTLILLTGNTMAQAVRERIPELAVLKTIGFSSRSVLLLVLGEAVLLIVVGAAIGLLLSTVAAAALAAGGGGQLPLLPVGGEIWLEGLSVAVVIGLLIGALPARRGMRLRIVDALAGR